MKIIFEATKGRLKDVDSYEKAIHILEHETQQGFFRARYDSEFKKFSPKSPFEDAKKITLIVIKVYGKGIYKLTGNLGYNGSTKQIKFYTTSVQEEMKFDFDDKNLVEFMNDGQGTFRDSTDQLVEIIENLKNSKPKGGSIRRPNQQGGRSNNNNKSKKKVDPRRQGLSETQKDKKTKKQQSKNYRTDSRRKVSNNKKQKF